MGEAKCGILCLTPETLDKPWVAFEAGALVAKFEQARVIPLLIGQSPGDVRYPFQALQCKQANREGLVDIVRAINLTVGANPLPEERLQKAFDQWWESLRQELTSIAKGPKNQDALVKKISSEEKLDEMLGLLRSMSKQASQPVEVPPPPSFSDLGVTFSTEWPPEFGAILVEVRKKRPLIAHWVASPVHVSRDNAGALTLYFAKEEAHSADSLRRDSTQQFLNGIAKPLGFTSVRIVQLE